MTLLDTVPDWLRYFRLTVKTENGAILFDSWSDNFQLFKFNDTLGGKVGTEIRLEDQSNKSFKNYKIKTFEVYSDMTTDQSDLNKKKFGWQIDIIV